ncbi:rCG51539 [Rattus norvegicus]|uniref:RCG51539 n=1 Tax=Rattus norvegicus TaxID=10116 RepID=A6IYI8_RAT|nr:rCG51539 [Rattus norvegicus]
MLLLCVYLCHRVQPTLGAHPTSFSYPLESNRIITSH